MAMPEKVQIGFDDSYSEHWSEIMTNRFNKRRFTIEDLTADEKAALKQVHKELDNRVMEFAKWYQEAVTKALSAHENTYVEPNIKVGFGWRGWI